ncbi:MAG: cupredoxin domain-containing protein [Comamonadaceae bacterium]|nr:cupredoxin domain-containing protein [Burkholderiales bacterium]MEB2349304.1 cupredoxin domain-containing protein [Comamonadaceae bacterium]
MRRRFLDALLVQGLAAALLACALPAARAADEMPVARVEFNDGAVNTRVIELPAKTRFLLEMVNNGKTPAEFESRSLGVEIVIPPGATRTRKIPPKMAGTYPFFDDFHMETTQGHIFIK